MRMPNHGSEICPPTIGHICSDFPQIACLQMNIMISTNAASPWDSFSEMNTAPDTFAPVQEQTHPERTRTATERPTFHPAREHEHEHDATRKLRGSAWKIPRPTGIPKSASDSQQTRYSRTMFGSDADSDKALLSYLQIQWAVEVSRWQECVPIMLRMLQFCSCQLGQPMLETCNIFAVNDMLRQSIVDMHQIENGTLSHLWIKRTLWR